MNKKLKNSIQFVLFLSIGVFLFWLVYRNTDFAVVWEEVKRVKYIWFIPAIIVFILSHFSRALRWMMLIEPLGYKPRFWNTLWAVLVMYFVNLGIPRMGEVARCGVVSKYDKIPVSKVLGTMITERIFDVIMLALLIVVVIIFNGDKVVDFLSQNPGMKENINALFSPLALGIIGALGVVFLVLLFFMFKGKFDHIAFIKRVHLFFRNLFAGLLSFRSIKRKWLFLLHSAFIWLMYFVMLYLCFFAFNFKVDLSLMSALLVFVAGSFGMMAPAPNGMGAWHFMIIQSLILLGVVQTNAEAFALIVHSLQTILIIIMGVIAFIALPMINRVPSEKNM